MIAACLSPHVVVDDSEPHLPTAVLAVSKSAALHVDETADTAIRMLGIHDAEHGPPRVCRGTSLLLHRSQVGRIVRPAVSNHLQSIPRTDRLFGTDPPSVLIEGCPLSINLQACHQGEFFFVPFQPTVNIILLFYLF